MVWPFKEKVTNVNKAEERAYEENFNRDIEKIFKEMIIEFNELLPEGISLKITVPKFRRGIFIAASYPYTFKEQSSGLKKDIVSITKGKSPPKNPLLLIRIEANTYFMNNSKYWVSLELQKQDRYNTEQFDIPVSKDNEEAYTKREIQDLKNILWHHIREFFLYYID